MTALRRLLLMAAIAFVVLAPRAALAAGVQLQTQVSAHRVGVGDEFYVQATALGESGERPSSPRLAVPPGITARGPSVSTQQQVSISGGQIVSRQGISATWTLVASRAGIYRIGPASVIVGTQKVDGQVVTVEVVQQSQSQSGPQRPQGFPIDPFDFDPFDVFKRRGMPSIPGFGQQDQNELENLPPVPDELRVDKALDPIAFLVAKALPKHVVVGEQVTCDVYAYGGRGPFREINPTEPSRSDFLAFVLLDNSFGEQQHRMQIGDSLWWAAKVRELALFPIKSGRLAIGAMRMGFEGRGYPSSAPQKGLVRDSLPVEITVDEPPLAARPAGYRVGDVGNYTLTANVEPRQVVAGDAVSVVAKLEGVGNVPNKLLTPQRNGVEWLEPTIVDDVEPKATIVGGYRKFSYVVRLKEAGNVDLGEITLPFWDPKKQSYGIARAALGAIDVTPGAGGKSAQTPPREAESFDSQIAPRTTLGLPAKRLLALADHGWFWVLVFIGPIGLVIANLGAGFGRQAVRRYRAFKEAHGTRASRSLLEARQAISRGEMANAASLIERALVLAIEGAIDLRARGVLRSELGHALEERGVRAETAAEVVRLFEACDDVRFTSEQAEPLPALLERASRVVDELGRTRRVRTSLPGSQPTRGVA